MKLLLIVIFNILLVVDLQSQVSQPNTITAYKIENDIKFDGILNEKCWTTAQKVSNFTQREMNEGEPVTEKTEVAVIYTEETLFIGVWCYDSEPDKLVAKEMKRDFQYWTEDNFEVIFDTFLDKDNGYIFVINPNGAKTDVQVAQQGEYFNIDWDGIWDARVINNNQGWFAEIIIPFSTFKFPDTEVQTWGINFERNIRRKREAAFWQGWSRDYDFEHVNHAGTLLGLKNIKGDENIELKPYISVGKEISNEDNNLFNIGADANYLITPRLKLNLTANTDFAQVESDNYQINLSRFSIYYPEKREFFLEGKDFFSFASNMVFYSRKIGISENQQIPIIGGARLMGTINKTNIGIISMQTATKDSTLSTNHSVVRIKQNFLKNSSIGMIFTSKINNGHYNYVYGFDATYVRDDFLGDKNLFVGAKVAQSITKEETNKNLSYNVYMNFPNDLMSIYNEFTRIDSKFNPELGFLNRKNYKYIRSKWEYKPRPEFIPLIQQLRFIPIDLNCYFTDNTNELESYDIAFTPLAVSFESGEFLSFSHSKKFDRLENSFTLFDSTEIKADEYSWNNYNLSFNTFEGRRISGGLSYNWGGFYSGKKQGVNTWLKLNANRHLNLYSSYSINALEFEKGYLNAHEVSARAEYSFNPRMLTSLFGQWNNSIDKIILNYRFHWIPTLGGDLYIVINQTLSTNNLKLKSEDFTILTKFVWRFGI